MLWKGFFFFSQGLIFLKKQGGEGDLGSRGSFLQELFFICFYLCVFVCWTTCVCDGVLLCLWCACMTLYLSYVIHFI